MGNHIKINTTSLGRDSDQVNSCIQKMKSEMAKMKSSASELDGMWDGPGSEAFKKAFQEDVKGMEILFKNLEEVYKYEVNAKKEYENCESKVYQLVSSIQI